MEDHARFCSKCGAEQSQASNNPEQAAYYENEKQRENYEFQDVKPYYQNEFQRILDSNEAYKGKWNWCAFLFGPWWALSKGLWKSLLIWLGLLVIGIVLEIPDMIKILSGQRASIFISEPWIYHIVVAIRGTYHYYKKYWRKH